jgi:hypothetical protein
MRLSIGLWRLLLQHYVSLWKLEAGRGYPSCPTGVISETGRFTLKLWKLIQILKRLELEPF